MRITNKIMRGNSLYNINLNKILEDRLNNQMTSQSKISRPSEDPVVAIRALRLRTNVSNITQYYEKNAPDAEQWLKVTGDALNTIDKILTDLYTQATDASKKSLTSDDLEIILAQMQALTKEFYASGNVDYAGRFVFSGYRTDTPITFSDEDIKEFTKDEKNPKTFKITEKIDYEDISTISYTDWSDYTDETKISNTTLYRIRLSYDDICGMDSEGFSFKINGVEMRDPVDANTFPPQVMSFDNAEEAYQAVKDGYIMVPVDPDDPASEMVRVDITYAYIPSTGEIVFSDKTYDNEFSENSSIEVTYSKNSWQKGDINPVHYFDCWSDGIHYNKDGNVRQDIYYDVGFNQEIQVNTTANEVFTHDVQRDIDDFQMYLKQLKDIEAEISKLEAERDAHPEDSDEYAEVQNKIDAVNKAYTYIRDNIQTRFENQMTKYQNYQEANNVAITQNGTRGSRLELISDRLMNQQATFQELQTANEGIDTTEIAVELKSAELTYEAALLATSKIMQTSLMNYI